MNIAFKNRELSDKRGLSENIDFWINRGCEIWHLDLPLKLICVLTLNVNTSMKKSTLFQHQGK